MNFDDTKQLLARVVALDNRTVDAMTITVWMEVLADYTLDEALWALREFARTNTTDYLRPAHLAAIINRKRREHAMSNPRGGQHADEWLAFETEVAHAAVENKTNRTKRLAVEAMDSGEFDG